MPKHFIFDCDDVLLDWQGGFVTFLKAQGYNVNPAGPDAWAMGSWIGCSDTEARQLICMFNASPAFGQLQPCAEAREMVWSLRDAGHTASVLTACGDFREIKEARRMNLHAVFDRDGEGAFNQTTFLPLGESKFNALWQFTRNRNPDDVRFVEDNFEHAKAGVANGIKTYCLRRTHNWIDEANDTGSRVIWITRLRHLQSREWK